MGTCRLEIVLAELDEVRVQVNKAAHERTTILRSNIQLPTTMRRRPVKTAAASFPETLIHVRAANAHGFRCQPLLRCVRHQASQENQSGLQLHRSLRCGAPDQAPNVLGFSGAHARVGLSALCGGGFFRHVPPPSPPPSHRTLNHRVA